MYTAEKISTCLDWNTMYHIATKVYVPWDKIYMPRAHGHTLMSSPVGASVDNVSLWLCLNLRLIPPLEMNIMNTYNSLASIQNLYASHFLIGEICEWNRSRIFNFPCVFA